MGRAMGSSFGSAFVVFGGQQRIQHFSRKAIVRRRQEVGIECEGVALVSLSKSRRLCCSYGVVAAVVNVGPTGMEQEREDGFYDVRFRNEATVKRSRRELIVKE